jgi:hypothetical protein
MRYKFLWRLLKHRRETRETRNKTTYITNLLFTEEAGCENKKEQQVLQERLTAYHKGGFVPIRLLSRALGLLRNGCVVCPLGSFLSIRIQHALNDCVGEAARSGKFRSPRQMRYFWDSSAIRLSPPLLADLQWVTQLLCLQSPDCPHWSRSIGLLVPREIMFTFLGDA